MCCLSLQHLSDISYSGRQEWIWPSGSHSPARMVGTQWPWQIQTAPSSNAGVTLYNRPNRASSALVCLLRCKTTLSTPTALHCTWADNSPRDWCAGDSNNQLVTHRAKAEWQWIRSSRPELTPCKISLQSPVELLSRDMSTGAAKSFFKSAECINLG